MKRTTYILMGLLVSGLIVIVATIITRYMSSEVPNNSIILGPERTEMNLNGVHVVKLIVNQSGKDEKKRIVIGGEFTITSSCEADDDRISFQKSQYLNVNQKEDTLLIAFDINAYNVPADVWKKNQLLVLGMDIQLSVDSLTIVESLLVNGSTLRLKELKADSLLIRSRGQSVLVDSCQFRSFDIAGLKRVSFEAKNSQIDNLYLDLDGIWNWQIQHSIIGTEYLTGTGTCTNNIQKGECDRVIWTPKNKDAALQLTLREKAEVNIMKE